MANRDDQRNNKRKESDCQNPASLPSRKTPPKRKDIKCDPPVTPAADDVFVEPAVCPPKAAPQLVVPDPLVIGNAAASADCPLPPDQPGNIGDTVNIPADTFTDFFNFGSIEGINTNQLTYISGLSEGQRAQLADPLTPVSTIQAITKLNTAQATFIQAQVAALKASVDAIAQEAANGQLSCLFYNVEQSVTCEDAGFPAGAYTNLDVPLGQEANVNNPSVISADIYASPNSQEEADDIAEDVATASLKCYYGNDEVTVTCLDAGFVEAVPNDVEPATSLDGRLRVGSVTIPADTIFSSINKAAANALAEALAEVQLVCFYVNNQVNLSCESIGKEGTAAGPADALSGKSGNPVYIPAGFVQSTVSTADANSRALIFAQSLLECFWVNTQQCKNCPIEEVTNPDDPDGPPFYVTAQEPGPSCVAPGEVRSYVSQADANEQAQVLAEAQLLCIYCNPIIYPKCVPETWSGTIPVPPEEVDSSWSISATRGAAAGTICSSNAIDTVGVAVSIGNTNADITDSNDCCYGNDVVSAECSNDELGNPPDPALSSDEVIIAANTIIVCDSDAVAAGWVGTTKAYATQLATQLAEAALLCIWSNAAQTESCPLPGGDDVVLGTSSITVDAGLFVSFRSQAEADSIASTVARSQLNCLYCNPGGENGSGSPCAVGELYLGQPTMDTCAFISAVSSADAAALANVISDSMAVCVSPDDLASLTGEPGNDGAQTGCSGNCYGYYS